MKILCCSDTHGKAPPVHPDADMILHAGDVYNHLGHTGKKNPLGVTYKEYIALANNKDQMMNWRKDWLKPVHFVRGNHDVEDIYSVMKFTDQTGAVERLSDNLLLVGIGWSGMLYYELPTERIINDVCVRLQRLIAMKHKEGDRFVVLTHYPPYFEGLYDNKQDPEGWMFRSIARLCDDIKPLAIIQGHVHELFGNAIRRDGALILCPGPKGMLLDLSGEAKLI